MKENLKSSAPKLTGTLFICASPIGNLGDVSHRLQECLASVSIIYCEDTRQTRVLCERLGVTTPLQSLDQHKEASRISDIRQVLDRGEDVAYVSDAGTPAVSDPGAYLVQELAADGYVICPIPGPSALTTFLSAAGVFIKEMSFIGFFPRKDSERRSILDAHATQFLVAFESPKRLKSSLEVIVTDFEVERFVAAKELSKSYERFFYSVSDLRDYLEADPSHQKGEWVFGVQVQPRSSDEATAYVQRLKDAGFSFKDTVSCARALSGVSKASLFEAYHD